MNSYTITIRSDSGEAEITVTVDGSGDVPRVTEVAIKAAEGTAVSAAQLHAINLDLLLRALSPPQDTPQAWRPVQQVSAQHVPDRQTNDAAPNGGRRDRSSSEVSNADTVESTRARAYRRMPADLAETYARSDSVTAVATHYGVPRHTAQGWIGRLRRRN